MDSNCNIQRIFKFSITKTNKFIVIFYGIVVNDIYLLASNENNIKSKKNEFSENPGLESHVVAHYATIHRSV
jgi:hypothetical protein